MTKTPEDIIRKRRCWPVDLDGDVVHVRALNQSERGEVSKFEDEDESYGYVIGCGLVSTDGSQVFARPEGEDAKGYGARVLTESDVPDDTRTQLTLIIMRLSAGPTKEQLEALKKK